MKLYLITTIVVSLFSVSTTFAADLPASSQPDASSVVDQGFTDAAVFSFSPEASGVENTKLLQHVVNQGGRFRQTLWLVHMDFLTQLRMSKLSCH